MVKTVFKIMAMILSALCFTVASAIDGTTFDPARFLGQLGLDIPPGPSLDAVIPDYMLGLYRQSTEKFLTPGVAVRSIKLEEVSANSSSCDSFSFLYDLSYLDSEEELLQATVRLPNVFGPSERPSLLLTSVDPSVTSPMLPEPSKVQPLHRRLSHRKEIVFVVTEEVDRCRELHFGNDVAARRKCSIVLKVTAGKRTETACRALSEGQDIILAVVTRQLSGRQPSSRVTRASDNRTPTWSARRPLSERLCQRKEMYVNFREIGWSDWIIAPAGYSAYYCAGSCPFPISEHLNTTNHAIIQTLAHSVNPLQVASTCCVPTHFAPISMLYYDSHNNVVLKQYDDMVVDACGCR